MHLCTQSMRDFVYMTLVFDDGKWVEAHKMILAASSCLCLAKTSIRVHPLIFMRGIQSNILEAFDLRGLCLMLGICALLFARPGRCEQWQKNPFQVSLFQYQVVCGT